MLPFKHAITGTALLALLGASPQPPSPIHIKSCDVKKLHSQYGLGNLFINGKGYNFFNVTFTNKSTAVAKHIVFQIEFEKSRYTVGDEGSFEPGKEITHRFRDHGKNVQAFARTGTGPTECSVLSVNLADGTSWKAEPQP